MEYGGQLLHSSERGLVEALFADPDMTLSKCALRWRGDASFVLWVIKTHHRRAYKLAAPKLRRNREFTLKAVRLCCGNYVAAGGLKADREIALVAVRENPYLYWYCPLRDDEEIALAAVTSCELSRVSKRLRGNYAVVMAAVTNGAQLQTASAALRDNEAIVLAAVRRSGWALRYASKRLRGKRSVVHAAVASSGAALQYASSFLRADRYIVLAAVRSSGALPTAFADDAEIATLAMATCPEMQSVSERLRHDPGVVLACIKKRGEEWWGCTSYSPRLMADKPFVLQALALNGYLLQTVSDELQSDADVVMAAVTSSGAALKVVPVECRTRRVVEAAIKSDGCAIRYAPDELKRELILAAVSQDGMAIRYALDPNKAVCLAAVRQDGMALMHTRRYDRDICMAAVRNNGMALEYVGVDDVAIDVAAVETHPYAYVDSTHKLDVGLVATFYSTPSFYNIWHLVPPAARHIRFFKHAYVSLYPERVRAFYDNAARCLVVRKLPVEIAMLVLAYVPLDAIRYA
jgi:hypothetical protein